MRQPILYLNYVKNSTSGAANKLDRHDFGGIVKNPPAKRRMGYGAVNAALVFN